jgi:hypothetical protein
MAQTPEGKVKKFIKEFLHKHYAYYFMPVQAGYGAPGLDFHCVYRGFAFFIEAKAPGKMLTSRQQVFFDTLKLHEAPCFKVSRKEDLQEVEAWMQQILHTVSARQDEQ